MKYLFLVTLVVLLLASVGLRASFPDVASDRPVLYWITDKNPARIEQVGAFHRWLVDQGHTAPDGGPLCELRLETSNGDMTKKVIQSVSGVGSDLVDLYGGSNTRLLASMGVLAELDEPAERLGFGLGQTYDAVRPEISVGGHQFSYLCNVTVRTMIVNPDAFDRVGLPRPPRRWTVKAFEEAGRAYVAAANPKGTRPSERRFFVDSLEIRPLWRSFGASEFNETGTASGLDAPGYRRALELNHRWIYEDRIMPTPDDVAAFASARGYGGAVMSLFGSGNYAMVTGGRYFLIQLRTYPNLTNLEAVEFPHGGYPDTSISTRAATVYEGGKNQELAHLFLAYLASDDYNALIVRDADALPPNPTAVGTEAYLRPPAHPGEWAFHGPVAEMAQRLGIGGSYSPFAQSTELAREREQFHQLYDLGRMSIDEAITRTVGAVNRRIRATVERKPSLRREFERRLVVQAAIDERNAADEQIPANWIFNAFFSRYYADTGRLGPEEPFPLGAGAPVAASAG